MGPRNNTPPAVPVPEPVHGERWLHEAPRADRAPSQPPSSPPAPVAWLKVHAKLILGAITVLGLVWGAATLASSKADRGDVESVKERMHRIELDVTKQLGTMQRSVDSIKAEQRMFIRAIRPDLPIPSDDISTAPEPER